MILALTRLYWERSKPKRPRASNKAISKTSRCSPPCLYWSITVWSTWVLPDGFFSHNRLVLILNASTLMGTSIMSAGGWNFIYIYICMMPASNNLHYRIFISQLVGIKQIESKELWLQQECTCSFHHHHRRCHFHRCFDHLSRHCPTEI